MIDFTSCAVNKFRAYGGANGNKINISYNQKSYMLKFPPLPSRNKTMSYTNGCISESQLATENMKSVPDSEDEINKRIYIYPASIIEENGKKISYFAFISSLQNSDCNAALKRIYSRINMEHLYRIVDETPTLLPVQKEFYKIMLYERKVKILDYNMEQLLIMEQSS